MGRKALLAVFCWLGFSGTSAKSQPVQTAYGVIDNISAESVPRLYRDVPVGVYASATPYAAYSFNVPSFVAKSSNAVPVKAENVIVQNANGYLRDSYGQRFIETPHTVAYKSMFPQQFVELQKLPAHLKQPLVAAAPSLQYGVAPHFFGQAHLGLTNLQTFAPTNVNQFSAQPLIYANNVRSLAPTTSLTSHFHVNPKTQQQSTSNNKVYLNKISPEQINSLEKETKFQRYQEPKISYISGNHNNKLTQGQKAQANTLQLVQVPKQTSVTTVTNGKKTVINLITKPPVPLLDLTLLEPLTFENPLVPQVQHFLPRIHQATYKKLDLPEINEVDEIKKHQMEIVVQKTKSYDSGVLKGKSKTSKKNQKIPQLDEKEEEEEVPPSVTVHELSEENPDISYEVKTPNYHETYTEQKMSYNKQTTSQPVNISYDKKTENKPKYYSYEKRTESEPIQYSYAHSSDPTKQINEEKNDENTKHLIYQFKPEEQNKENQEENRAITPKKELEESSQESDDSSEESDDDEQPHLGVPLQVLELVEEYHQKNPHKAAHITPEHKEEVYYQYSEVPGLQEHPQKHHTQQHQQQQHHQEQKQQQQASPHPRNPSQNDEQYFQPITPEYEEDIIILPTHKPHSEEKQNHNYNIEINHDAPQQRIHPAHYNHYQSYQAEPQSHLRQNDHQHNHQADPHSHSRQNDHQQSYQAEPQSNPRPNNPQQSYQEEPRPHPHQNNHQQNYQAHPQSHPHQNNHQQNYQAEPQSHPRQNNPQQSYQEEPRPHSHQNNHQQNYQAEPQSHPHQNNHQQNYQAEPQSHSKPRQNDHQEIFEAEPHSHEKTNRIIVKERTKSETELPNEELMAEMVKKQEESEEDFEKAYKDAAYGFPAYDTSAIDVEKEIYDPNTYGASRYHNHYDIVKSPLRQYEADGDLYPAFARLEYKDVRDKTSDGYYDEYEARRPESLRQLNKKKEDYYENYKKNKPEKYTAAPSQEQYYEKQPKQKQSAKYREAPLSQKYAYKKESQRDNSAHASRPYQRYKSKTQFVEPQYQYGFEPVSIPRLLDSELAAMASSNNPKSEKLDTRKRIITENFYYKKTSKAGKAGS